MTNYIHVPLISAASQYPCQMYANDLAHMHTHTMFINSVLLTYFVPDCIDICCYKCTMSLRLASGSRRLHGEDHVIYGHGHAGIYRIPIACVRVMLDFEYLWSTALDHANWKCLNY